MNNTPTATPKHGSHFYKEKGMVPLTGWVHKDIRDDAKILAGSLGMTMGEYLTYLIDRDDESRNG